VQVDENDYISLLSALGSECLGAIKVVSDEVPAYDIVSTVIYDSSTKDMAMNIDGSYNLGEITRDSFAAEAKLCGLGVKPALAAFDAMSEHFPAALDQAADTLEKQGFSDAKDIAQRIIAKRGLLML
jgi:serine/threonine-protein kinase HipA